MHAAGNIVIALAVLALILSRQLRTREVREEQPYRIMAILAVIGVVEVVQFAQHHDVPGVAWALIAASLVVGAALGVARGLTVHVWREDGVLYRKGNAVTLVLWLISLGSHIALDAVLPHTGGDASGLGSTSILLYLAVTLGVQQLYVLQRAEHLPAAPVSSAGSR